MRKHAIRLLCLMATVATSLVVMAPSAEAATTTPAPNTIVRVTITPLDMVTGQPIAASTTEFLTATDYFNTGYYGHSTDVGRALFSVDMTHDVGCLIGCFTSYHHITQVDMQWIRVWRWTHAVAWAKYTPVGSTWMHYAGQSQPYGGDQANYYVAYFGYPTSGFHYRGTATNVFSIPGIGDAYLNDSNNMWIRYDGVMYWTKENTG